MYKQKVKDMFVDTSHLFMTMHVFHNNCIRQIEQLQNVAPTSMLAITELRADTDKIGTLPFVYSVDGPSVQSHYAESLAEIIEYALDYYSELAFYCAPEPAMFQLIITDGRETAMWHQPLETVFVLCPVRFVNLEDGSRFLLECKSTYTDYPTKIRNTWTKNPERYLEQALVWVPLRNKSLVLTARSTLKQGKLLKDLIGQALDQDRYYEDIEDGVSDALEAAALLIPA